MKKIQCFEKCCQKCHILWYIMHSLQQNNKDIKMCRGQSYDGASAMSSERIGVQAKIKGASPLALYTHCRSHVLNLSIASACKIAQIKYMIDIVNEVFKFFNNSPKRQKNLNMFWKSLNQRQKRTRLKVFVEPAGLKDIPVLRLFMNYMYTYVAHLRLS